MKKILTTLLHFIPQDTLLRELPHLCKTSSGVHGWLRNKASSVVLCAHEFKSLHITQEKEFGVGWGFNSVVFRSDCGGEVGRSPWRMLSFLY
jgi:hypothetical protein